MGSVFSKLVLIAFSLRPAQSLQAGFLLTRGDHSWFGFGWIYLNPLVWYPEWDVDYGVPLGPMTIVGNVASRNWTKISVALDLESLEATFHPSNPGG